MMADNKKIDAASTIKAILQMGNSCEVVVTRLTRAEIEKYTRKKQHEPDNRQDRDLHKEKEHINMSRKRKRARVIYSSDEESTDDSSDRESVKESKVDYLKCDDPEKSQHKKFKTKNCSEKEKSDCTKSIVKVHKLHVHDSNKKLECPVKVHHSDSSSKKKRKMELLFGDDYDDVEETPKRKSECESRKHSGPTHLSTTINVNFYYKEHSSDKNEVSTLLSSKQKTSERHLKESNYKEVHKSHKSKHKSKTEYASDKTSKKCDSGLKKIDSKCIEISKTYSKGMKTDSTDVEDIPKNNVKNDKIQLKLNNPPLKRSDSEGTDNTALMQGIWSSLGMQSPADRSDRIISNTLSETCTLYKAVNSKNDILLASGVAAEHNTNTVSLKVKYVNEKPSVSDGTVSDSEALFLRGKENSEEMCLVNADSAQVNKNKETDINNRMILHSGNYVFESVREDVVKRNNEVNEVSKNTQNETVEKIIELDKENDCHIASGNTKIKGSYNSVNIMKPVSESRHEIEVSQTVRKISGSETCSKGVTDKRYAENHHTIVAESNNNMNKTSCIELLESVNVTNRTETCNSAVAFPDSVDDSSRTETCSSSIPDTTDYLSSIEACSSIEAAETTANDITLITSNFNSASEKNTNKKNTILNNNEKPILGTDINISKDSVVISNSKNSATTSRTVTNSNVGKIRVKDPKLLGIQSFGVSNSGPSTSTEAAVVSEHTRLSVEDMTIEEIISGSSIQNFSENDILVLKNYKKYFNELIESKLPKMGELLDLAVADAVRKDERIHRSEKLTSPDLIKQEKLRAEREFSDTLKTRGIEFTALLESIVKKFDADCAEDMTFALYSRILGVFRQIDKQNRKNIGRTRSVVKKMLHKNNYKNEIIYKILSMKNTDFSQRVLHMSQYILTYNNLMKAVCSNSASETQPTIQSTVNTTSTLPKNTTKENVAAVAATSETYLPLNKDISVPVINLCGTTDVHASLKNQNNVQANSSSSVSDQRGSLNSNIPDVSYSGMLVNNSMTNLKQLIASNSSAAIPNQHVADYNHNRNTTSTVNHASESQYGNHLPSYSSQSTSSVNKGATVVNQSLDSVYFGLNNITNTGNISHLNNIQANNPVVNVNTGNNSSLTHLQKSNDHTAGSRTRPVNDIGRQNIVSHQQINSTYDSNGMRQILQKHALESNFVPSPSSMNSRPIAVARNQPAVVQTNANSNSANMIAKEILKSMSNQQSQNSLLLRQEPNINTSRMNMTHSNIPNMMVGSGHAGIFDRSVQQTKSSLMRNPSVVQPAGNMHDKLINQHQTAVGTDRNNTCINNMQQHLQVESGGRVPFTQPSVNWQTLARDLGLMSSSMDTMPGQSTTSNNSNNNHNYSPRQITSNIHYSNQNTSHNVSRANNSSVETTTVSNKQPDANVQNKNITPLATEVIPGLSNCVVDSQQAAGNRPPPPPYPFSRSSRSELLLKYLLRSDSCSVPYPESESLKKVVEDRVYLEKQSSVARNRKIVSRVVGQQNGNVMKLQQLSGSDQQRTLDSQNTSVIIQPKEKTLYSVGGNGMSNTNVPPNTVHTQRVTTGGANPNEISYQRIRQVVDVHNMKNYPLRNVPIAPRPPTNSFVQTVTVSKTQCSTTVPQNKLPVISEVFSCRAFTLPDQSISTQNGFTSVMASNNNNNNNNNNNVVTQHVPENTNYGSSLQSSTTLMSDVNSNSCRSPVQRHSTEAQVSNYANTLSPQNSQLLAPNNSTSGCMPSSVSGYTNAVSKSNFQPAYSINVQSVLQSNSDSFNTSVISSIGANVPSHSAAALPHNNTNDVSTSSVSSGHTTSVLPSAYSDDNPLHIPSAIIHHLPSSVSEISEILPITADHSETEATVESQGLTCARSGCSQKSSKLCSVCKCTTYCSLECQHIYADRQGPCDNNANQYSEVQQPDEYMDIYYLFSD